MRGEEEEIKLRMELNRTLILFGIRNGNECEEEESVKSWY